MENNDINKEAITYTEEGRKALKEAYPSNSKFVREKETEEVKPEKRVTKVIKGNVVTKKKSFGRKLTDTFFGESVTNVGSYIVNDVIIPTTKNLLNDMVRDGFEMWLFGETRGRRDKDRGKNGYVSYNKMNDRDRREDRRDYAKTRSGYDFDDIVLESKYEAEEVIDQLVLLIRDYDQATVADLYDLVGKTGKFTDNKWGWENLRSAQAVRVRHGGWLLDLPKPIRLD